MTAMTVWTMVASMMAVFVAISGLLVAMFKRGTAEGRTMEILSHLTQISQDHETRLRSLEQVRH